MSKFIQPAIILGLIVALFVSIDKCNSNKQDTADLQATIDYKNQQIDSLKNKYNQVVTEQDVIKTSSESTIAALSDEVFNLKKKDERQLKQITALLRFSNKTQIDTVEVPYVVYDSTGADTGLIARNQVVIPPKDFADSTKDYQISGTVLLKGVRINHLAVPDAFSVRVAEEKEGFFKPRKTVIQAIHTNPLVTTNGMSSVILTQKPTAWQRWIKTLVVGVAASVVTYKVAK